jgi:hypothetical protein
MSRSVPVGLFRIQALRRDRAVGTVRRRAPPDLRRRPPVAGTPLLSRAVEGNKRYHAIDMHRIVGRIREIRRLRRVYTDRLLTLLTVVLMLAMFVFAPLQAVGIFVFQGFAIAALLAIIGSMFVISDHPAALAVMFVCLTANIVVFVLRLYYPPWPYNLYVLASAWLAIAVTLGAVVAQAVFRRGRVTYHRIVGAILLYLLIAVLFGTLYIFVGLSIPDAIKGITFEDNAALANSVFYLSFVTLTSTGYGDIVPVHPIARTLCILETVIGQLYPATLLARIVTLEMRQGSD